MCVAGSCGSFVLFRVGIQRDLIKISKESNIVTRVVEHKTSLDWPFMKNWIGPYLLRVRFYIMQ